MPTYDYLCNDCGSEFERIHGFGKTPEPCKCGSSNIKIVINQVPMGFVKGEPTTLGQLSESNTKKMGHYELQDKRAYQEEGKVKKEKSWWQKSGSASKSEISNMTEKQKANYILKGDKNG